jgi:aspartate dehydrogenase
MPESLGVAIGGLGAIGMAVARKLDEGIEGLHLAAVSARDREAAASRMQGFRTPVPVVAAGELADHGDIVVECAPAAVFTEIAEPALKAGRILMPLSVGQLLDHPEYEDLAQAHGARIVAPTGALLGLDAVRAAAEGTIESVTMVTRKPPGGLAGAPYLEAHGISLEDLAEPAKIFAGTAREGARGFPANVNVAAALSLAGIGPDRTRLEIWADPTVTRNTHTIRLEADSVRFEMTIENVPSEANPRTGKLTGLSVIDALRGLVAPMRVGT